LNVSQYVIVTDGYFDGVNHHGDGPYSILVDEACPPESPGTKAGVIQEVVSGDLADTDRAGLATSVGRPIMTIRTSFVMPALVESHCHTFLDGATLSFPKRSEYLKAPREAMLSVARSNLAATLDAGITLIRDAGDIHGINTEMKRELDNDSGSRMEMLSAGIAIRKAKRYGSFMAREVVDSDDIVRVIREVAPNAGQLKVLLTGIIDFEKGIVRGPPQFSLEETRRIVETARELGLLTFTHCSGEEGLKIAVETGIDCIEHGFFMTRRILDVMAEKGIAWTPTYSPVAFQLCQPRLAGWNSETCDRLRGILRNHDEHVALAYELGVPVLAGSDAGSYGVAHGRGLIDELFHLRNAGVSVEQVLASATSLPRRLWGCSSADIVKGNHANLLLLEESPFDCFRTLREPQLLCRVSSMSRSVAS
jgi:imidazolonepropionase-like amidohydrolase|tara:strand:- start:52590 stop:53855 length:1266 start_codon:yes stop_codon:yes gene_type:complete